MQRKFTRIITLLLFFLFFIILIPSKSYAVAPNLRGYVLTKTGTPVVGVWVKWIENDDEDISEPNTGVRYAQTDTNGRFTFTAWQTLLFKPAATDPDYNIEYRTFIDTDLDGVNDARMNNISIPADPWDAYHHFGCGQNTHLFQVVMPKGWTGSFNDAIFYRVDFQNIGAEKDIGTIYYDNTVNADMRCDPTQLYSEFQGETIRVTNIDPAKQCAWNGAIYPQESSIEPNIQYGPAAVAGYRILSPGESYIWDFNPLMIGYSYNGATKCFINIYSFSPEQNYSPPAVFGTTPNFGTRLLGGDGFGWTIRDYTALPGCTAPVGSGTYKISGTVFVDSNKNGIRDGGEPGFKGATVSISGAKSASTVADASGNYSFINLANGNYTITIANPVGYEMTTVTTQNVTIGPNQTVDFGVHRFFSIAGYVFNDISKDNFRDSTEPYYTSGITITSSGGTLYLDAATGTFDVNELNAGTYTIAYTSLPTNYRVVYPKNGPPPSYTVTVGPSCMVDATTGATCTVQGDIIKLGFAISDSIPWIQSTGGGIVMDNGYVNYIPSAPTCATPHAILGAGGNNPSVIASGDVDPYFGYGSSSSTEWITGGLAYPNLFKSNGAPLQTSYATLLANLNKGGVTITNIQTLSGCGNLSSCTLPNSLNASNAPRVFRANGNVTLNGFSFPGNKNFIFLINGDLRIQGDIDVPTGGTVIFSASRDIIIDRTIGEAPTCTPSNNRGIEGIFSADRDVTVEGTPNCAGGADPMLKIEGIVIVNAKRNGGAFTNNRDLCANNRNYPSIQFISRPDFILNAPEVLKRKSFLYQEVAP